MAEQVDFLKLSASRLGEAYVRMNGWEWDDICGPKPEGFDEMTNCEKHRLPEFNEAFQKVELFLTHEQRSMFWWIIELHKSYEEWHKWYYDTSHPEHRIE